MEREYLLEFPHRFHQLRVLPIQSSYYEFDKELFLYRKNYLAILSVQLPFPDGVPISYFDIRHAIHHQRADSFRFFLVLKLLFLLFVTELHPRVKFHYQDL